MSNSVYKIGANMSKRKPILPVAMDEHLKKAFIRCCKNQDRNAAQVVREFVRQYVAKHGQEKLL